MATEFIIIKYYSDGSGRPSVVLAQNVPAMLAAVLGDTTGNQVAVLRVISNDVSLIYSDNMIDVRKCIAR